MMEYTRQDFERIQNEVVDQICALSEYTPVEAKQIYLSFPYYILLLRKLSKGESNTDVAWFILNELKLSKS